MVGRNWRDLRFTIAMVLVQIGFAGMNIMFKLAIKDGMSLQILSAYRLIFATFFMLSFAFLFQRTMRPELSWRLLLLSLLSGLLGAALPTSLFVAGISLTTATFASAATILTPIVTFVMAVVLRMERLRLGTRAGKAKVTGTLLGVGGVLVFTFCKGARFHPWSTGHTNMKAGKVTPQQISLLGAILVFGSNFSYALWLLLQVRISQHFGGCYWNTALMNVTGSIMTTVLALCWNQDFKAWRLGWDIRLFTALYSGILISGIAITVTTWCVEARGPLFASTFSPLGLVVVAVVGSLVLHESFTVGSIVGAFIIVGGLYLVLWGKTREVTTTPVVTTIVVTTTPVVEV